MLRSLGVGSNYFGYKDTIEAVKLVLEDPNRLLSVTKMLYPEVIKRTDSTKSTKFSVERNIRTVVQVAYRRNPELLAKIAGYPLDGAPRASQFIAMLADYIKNY